MWVTITKIVTQRSESFEVMVGVEHLWKGGPALEEWNKMQKKGHTIVSAGTWSTGERHENRKIHFRRSGDTDCRALTDQPAETQVE